RKKSGRGAPAPVAKRSNRGRIGLLFAVAGLLVGGGVWAAHRHFDRGLNGRRLTRSVEQRPNVLFISIDMLRPDHLHCYGYPRQTSPHLDQLAAEGVLFQNQISSSSWTLPAHAAMFTSQPDTVHGCTDTDRRLPSTLTSLPERFLGADYR